MEQKLDINNLNSSKLNIFKNIIPNTLKNSIKNLTLEEMKAYQGGQNYKIIKYDNNINKNNDIINKITKFIETRANEKYYTYNELDCTGARFNTQCNIRFNRNLKEFINDYNN
jgi:hypothetical protein